MLRQILRRASFLPVCRHGSAPSRLVKAVGAIAAPLVTILALAQPVAQATPVISGLNYTGANIPVGSGGQDTSWQVAALPAGASVAESTPYQAWVFSGKGTVADPASWVNVPDPWFSGHANVGLPGYGRWIGAQENNSTALLPDSAGGYPPNPGIGYYSTIYSTTFQSSEAGSAFIWLTAAADNAVTFFVNGSVTGGTSNQPTITGGSQVGPRAQGLAKLKVFSGYANVVAGTNTLYAVVDDIFNPTTKTFGYTGLIVVPEPSTISSVGVAAAGVAVAAAGRRLRRRPRG